MPFKLQEFLNYWENHTPCLKTLEPHILLFMWPLPQLHWTLDSPCPNETWMLIPSEAAFTGPPHHVWGCCCSPGPRTAPLPLMPLSCFAASAHINGTQADLSAEHQLILSLFCGLDIRLTQGSLLEASILKYSIPKHPTRCVLSRCCCATNTGDPANPTALRDKATALSFWGLKFSESHQQEFNSVFFKSLGVNLPNSKNFH